MMSTLKALWIKTGNLGESTIGNLTVRYVEDFELNNQSIEKLNTLLCEKFNLDDADNLLLIDESYIEQIEFVDHLDYNYFILTSSAPEIVQDVYKKLCEKADVSADNFFVAEINEIWSAEKATWVIPRLKSFSSDCGDILLNLNRLKKISVRGCNVLQVQ